MHGLLLRNIFSAPASTQQLYRAIPRAAAVPRQIKKRPASVPYMQAIRSTTFQTPPGIVVVTMVTLKHKKL